MTRDRINSQHAIFIANEILEIYLENMGKLGKIKNGPDSNEKPGDSWLNLGKLGHCGALGISGHCGASGISQSSESSRVRGGGGEGVC